MGDIRSWLGEHGLDKYADAFVENDIGLDVVAELDREDLKDLGVSLGDGKRLLKAARALAAEATPTELPDSEPPLSSGRSATDAERRQLTVMFCDLVGSTALAESMDPEDYGELLSVYQDAARAAIALYEGYIARYMGDGLLVYFGYPQAHEDDAERAVRAALDIVVAVRNLEHGHAGELAVRIGVATGPVVAGDIVGEGASEERAVLGETPNLAARLQGIAEPNAVVIAPVTYRLVAGRFDMESLGIHRLKGISKPVPAYRVVTVRSEATRFEAAQLGAMSQLRGRDSELALFGQRWELARAGEGQVVLLQGEPGIGKSRLVRALRDRFEEAAAVVQTYQCSPYQVATAFYPVIDLLGRAARFSPEDDTEAKLDKLEATLGVSLPEDETAVTLIAALLSLPTDRYAPLDMTPQERRAKTIDVLAAQVAKLTREGAVLLLVEDAHWSDPSTVEFLAAVIDRIQSLPILALITYRPEFGPPWTGYGHVTAHSLNRLGRREALGVVENVTRGKAIPPEVLDQIVEKTDGVPLFIEELTKTILEAGFLSETEEAYVLDSPVPALAIPATLHDALLARLDRLSRAKEIAQIGACIGRQFGYELLAEISPLRGGELDAALGELAGSELVFRRGEPPAATYTFKHALVQDAAYQSLLRGRRQSYHQRIAEVLEARLAETKDTQPELLAHHYACADLNERAAEYRYEAAERASERSAHVEAVTHLREVIALLGDQPASDDSLRIAIRARNRILGYGWRVRLPDGEARELFEETRVLARRAHDSESEVLAIWAYGLTRGSVGQVSYFQERCEEAIGLAREAGLKEAAALIHYPLGFTTLYTGPIAECEQRIAVVEDAVGTDWDFGLGLLGFRVSTFVQGLRTKVAIYSGRLAEAALHNRRFADLVRSTNEQETETWVLSHNVYRAHLGGWAERSLEDAQRAFDLAEQLDNPSFLVESCWALAIALRARGELEGAAAMFDRAVEDSMARRAWGWDLPGVRCDRAELLLQRGAPEAALAEVEEARQLAVQGGNRLYAAYGDLCRARIWLAIHGNGRAHDIRVALDDTEAVSRDIGAESFIPQIAEARARLAAVEGHADEARRLLRQSHALFEAIGATGHAARVAREL